MVEVEVVVEMVVEVMVEVEVVVVEEVIVEVEVWCWWLRTQSRARYPRLQLGLGRSTVIKFTAAPQPPMRTIGDICR